MFGHIASLPLCIDTLLIIPKRVSLRKNIFLIFTKWLSCYGHNYLSFPWWLSLCMDTLSLQNGFLAYRHITFNWKKTFLCIDTLNVIIKWLSYVKIYFLPLSNGIFVYGHITCHYQAGFFVYGRIICHNQVVFQLLCHMTILWMILKANYFVCLIWFFTSHQQSFS